MAKQVTVNQDVVEQVAVNQDGIFTIFGEPIENVHEFKYLGRYVTNTDDDTVTIRCNLKKANEAWGHLHRLILYEKKRNLRAAVSVYRSIVESILLYGSDTWVLQGYKVLDLLEKFHRRCARFLTEIGRAHV